MSDNKERLEQFGITSQLKYCNVDVNMVNFVMDMKEERILNEQMAQMIRLMSFYSYTSRNSMGSIVEGRELVELKALQQALRSSIVGNSPVSKSSEMYGAYADFTSAVFANLVKLEKFDLTITRERNIVTSICQAVFYFVNRLRFKNTDDFLRYMAQSFDETVQCLNNKEHINFITGSFKGYNAWFVTDKVNYLPLIADMHAQPQKYRIISMRPQDVHAMNSAAQELGITESISDPADASYIFGKLIRTVEDMKNINDDSLVCVKRVRPDMELDGLFAADLIQKLMVVNPLADKLALDGHDAFMIRLKDLANFRDGKIEFI